MVSGQRLNRRQDTPRRSAAAENEAQRDADAHRGQNRADWLVLGEILHARHGLPTDILRLPCDLIGFSAELGGRVTHQTAHSVLHPALTFRATPSMRSEFIGIPPRLLWARIGSVSGRPSQYR